MILNLFFIMTRITLKTTGNQLSCLSPNKIDRKCKARKLITYYHRLFLSLCKHMGLHSLQQDYKERRCQWSKKEPGDLVGFLHDFKRSLHPLSVCNTPHTTNALTKSARNSASFCHENRRWNIKVVGPFRTSRCFCIYCLYTFLWHSISLRIQCRTLE
jgi:hypothetical protein